MSFKFKSSATGNNFVFASDDLINFQQSYSISMQSGQIVFIVNNGTVNRQANTLRTFNDDNWHHCILTADRDFGIKIYVDGRLERESIESNWTLDTDRSAQANIFIGCSGSVGSTAIGQFTFLGSLDEFAWWDYALTPDEAYALWLWQDAGNSIA